MQTAFTLRPYQSEGVNRLVELTAPTRKARAAILADEPGLGKTAQVAEFINRTKPARVLIVCPASLRLNWRYELETWMKHVPAELVIVSYNLVSPYVARTWDLAVFDEAHYLKTPDTKRTKNCLAVRASVRLYLTGTPVVNRPIELYPILSTIGLKLSRKDYGERYCNGHYQFVPVGSGGNWKRVWNRGRYEYHPCKGGPWRRVWNDKGASRTDELGKMLREHVMVRRTKAEVLTELPDKIRQVVELDIPDGESDELREAVGRFFDGMEQAAENLSELKKIAFDQLAKARLDIARNKLPCVVKFVHDLLEEEEKIVIFAWHREIVEALVSEFKAVCIYGGMTDKQKDAAVQEFQHGPTRVMVGQIASAGVGLTFTAAHTVVFAELDWVPGNVTQAEDRCHRLGQHEPVRVFHLVAQGSVDARMVRALVHKQQTIESLRL